MFDFGRKFTQSGQFFFSNFYIKCSFLSQRKAIFRNLNHKDMESKRKKFRQSEKTDYCLELFLAFFKH